MRGAIPGREPHLFKKKRANKISSKRWKHIKTHNENAIRSMEIYQKKRKKLNNYGYYTKKMENLETATPLFNGNMIIIPSIYHHLNNKVIMIILMIKMAI